MAKAKKTKGYQQTMDAALRLGQMQNLFKYRFRELQGIHDAMSLIARTPNAVISPEATMAIEKRVVKIQKEIMAHCEAAFDRKNRAFRKSRSSNHRGGFRPSLLFRGKVMKPVYDNYEIHGCQRLDGAGLPQPDGENTKTCDEAEAQFWTLYGHIMGQGVEAIGDFPTREAAEECCYRITGHVYGYPGRPLYDTLLDALEDLMIQADEDCPIQYRSSHLSNALTQAMLLLEMTKPDKTDAR